jgi:hypothetical protein
VSQPLEAFTLAKGRDRAEIVGRYQDEGPRSCERTFQLDDRSGTAQPMPGSTRRMAKTSAVDVASAVVVAGRQLLPWNRAHNASLEGTPPARCRRARSARSSCRNVAVSGLLGVRRSSTTAISASRSFGLSIVSGPALVSSAAWRIAVTRTLLEALARDSSTRAMLSAVASASCGCAPNANVTAGTS